MKVHGMRINITSYFDNLPEGVERVEERVIVEDTPTFCCSSVPSRYFESVGCECVLAPGLSLEELPLNTREWIEEVELNLLEPGYIGFHEALTYVDSDTDWTDEGDLTSIEAWEEAREFHSGNWVF